MHSISGRHRSVLPDTDACTGCEACVSICPVNCIVMEKTEEGFLYPVIDSGACIDCKKCFFCCPTVNRSNPADFKVTGYAAKNRDDIVRKKSSSGGIFAVLSEFILSLNGVVIGAAIKENGRSVAHTVVDSTEDLEKLFTSKYVQSSIGNIYIRAKETLENGRWVLFSGTPCQVEGFLSYLGDDVPLEKLVTIDFICHGVPSPQIWMDYLSSLESTYSSGTESLSFRDKVLGWHDFSLTVTFKNGEHYTENFKKDFYLQGFIKNAILRKSCYHCAFKGIHRNSDITLADFWGIQTLLPDWDDDMGVSAILVQSQKGADLINQTMDHIDLQKVPIKAISENNTMLTASVPLPEARKLFFSHLSSIPLEQNLFLSTFEPHILRALRYDSAHARIKIIIMGTGGLLEKNIQYINCEKYEVIEFWDNDIRKHGTMFMGRVIKIPYYRKDMEHIVIMSSWFQEIKDQLLNLGYAEDMILPSEYFKQSQQAQTYFPVTSEDLSKYLN